MDSAIDLNDGKGFKSVDNINKQPANSTGGSFDVTVATDEAAPTVTPTTEDPLNMHGPGEWDNTVYGGDPYSSSVPSQAPLSGGGPR